MSNFIFQFWQNNLRRLRNRVDRPAPRRVVYTCLFGKYETLTEQVCENCQDVKFICFTDQEGISSKTWDITLIETHLFDSARESRRQKLLPHLFIGSYDESIYIDNSVILKIDPSIIFDTYLTKPGHNFVCFRHPWRDCVYDEAEEVIKNGIDDESRVREQIDCYRDIGFPSHLGLIAGTFLLRRHNHPEIKRLSEMWFDHVLRYSKRDQLSFNFCAWRQNFPFGTIELPLTSNPLFKWPVSERRIPYGFKGHEYLWLNADVARSGTDPYEHMFNYGHREGRRYRYHDPLYLDNIANKYRTDKGSLYYNRHFYSRIYDSYLHGMKEDRFTLVEIGLLRHDVQSGSVDAVYDHAPSLFMWRDYFKCAQIHGVDIADFSSVADDRITFTRADQSKVEDLDAVVRNCRDKIRIIIDDASHASHHQQICLAYLFPKLASGGIYFIEDLHYQPSHLELQDVPQTRDLLFALQRGERPRSPFISEEALDRLIAEIAEIRFFDSMDYASGLNGADALAAIRKR